ncbi:hypothetical protein D3C80_2033400 [compost metagenome]
MHLNQWPGGSRANAQLLLQFARQGRLHRLAGFHLAAREFPQATLVLVGRAPGNQDAAISGTDHRGGYMNAFHPSCSSCAA